MKRIISMVAIIVMLASSVAFGATRLLSGATATGAGGDLVSESDTYAVVATFTNASTMVLGLEGHDGYVWTSLGTYTIDATDIAAGKFRWDINSRLTDKVRPNITTLTGGGATVSVTVDSK